MAAPFGDWLWSSVLADREAGMSMDEDMVTIVGGTDDEIKQLRSHY